MEPGLLAYVPNHFKTQEMCNDPMDIGPHYLAFVPDSFKTQEMCTKAVFCS